MWRFGLLAFPQHFSVQSLQHLSGHELASWKTLRCWSLRWATSEFFCVLPRETSALGSLDHSLGMSHRECGTHYSSTVGVSDSLDLSHNRLNDEQELRLRTDTNLESANQGAPIRAVLGLNETLLVQCIHLSTIHTPTNTENDWTVATLCQSFPPSHHIWPFQFHLLALTIMWNFLQQPLQGIFLMEVIASFEMNHLLLFKEYHTIVLVFFCCRWTCCLFVNLIQSDGFTSRNDFPSSFLFTLFYFLSLQLRLVGPPLLFSQCALKRTDSRSAKAIWGRRLHRVWLVWDHRSASESPVWLKWRLYCSCLSRQELMYQSVLVLLCLLKKMKAMCDTL